MTRLCRGLRARRPRDVSTHATTMRRGDPVLLLFGSANLDERVFDDSDTFVIDRKPQRPVAFAPESVLPRRWLARLEARIALRLAPFGRGRPTGTSILVRRYGWSAP